MEADQQSYICDFCSDPEVVGFIPMESFTIHIGGHPWSSEGDWAVCAFCETLLASNRVEDFSTRAERVVRERSQSEKADPELAVRAFRLIQKEFLRRWGSRGCPGAIPMPDAREKLRSVEALSCAPGPAQLPVSPKSVLKMQQVIIRGMREFSEECRELAEWGNPRSEQTQSWSDLQEAITCASTMIWDPPIWNAAIRGSSDAFETCDLRQLSWPVFPQLWTFPLDKPPANLHERNVLHKLHVPEGACSGMLVMGCSSGRSRSKDHTLRVENCGLQIVLVYWTKESREWALGDADPVDFRLDIALPRIRFLEPVWHGQEWVPPIYQAVQAALHFLALPFVGTHREKFNRSNERSFEKMTGKQPDVKTVILRRPERKGEPSGDGEKRDWSCSWIVSSHWRRQYYPSTGDHRPKYIAAHLKGPEDKAAEVERRHRLQSEKVANCSDSRQPCLTGALSGLR